MPLLGSCRPAPQPADLRAGRHPHPVHRDQAHRPRRRRTGDRVRRQLVPALVAFLALTVLSVASPAAVTGVSQVVFPACGRLARRARREHGRLPADQAAVRVTPLLPAAPVGCRRRYDGCRASASNSGRPTRTTCPRCRRGSLPPREPSRRRRRGAGGCGHCVRLRLDPHISPATSASRRPASHAASTDVLALVDNHIDGRSLGFLGEPGVNVVGTSLSTQSAAERHAIAHGARDAAHLPRGAAGVGKIVRRERGRR